MCICKQNMNWLCALGWIALLICAHGREQRCKNEHCEFQVTKQNEYDLIECTNTVQSCTITITNDDNVVEHKKSKTKKKRELLINSAAQTTNITCINNGCHDININCGNFYTYSNPLNSECYINAIISQTFAISNVNISCHGSNINICKYWTNIEANPSNINNNVEFDCRINENGVCINNNQHCMFVIISLFLLFFDLTLFCFLLFCFLLFILAHSK